MAPSGSQLDGKSACYTGQGTALAHAAKQVLDGGLAWNFHVPRRPLGAVPTAGVADWIAAMPPGVLPVSVLTMGEIGQGIARIRGLWGSKMGHICLTCRFACGAGRALGSIAGL